MSWKRRVLRTVLRRNSAESGHPSNLCHRLSRAVPRSRATRKPSRKQARTTLFGNTGTTRTRMQHMTAVAATKNLAQQAVRALLRVGGGTGRAARTLSLKLAQGSTARRPARSGPLQQAAHSVGPCSFLGRSRVGSLTRARLPWGQGAIGPPARCHSRRWARPRPRR